MASHASEGWHCNVRKVVTASYGGEDSVSVMINMPEVQLWV